MTKPRHHRTPRHVALAIAAAATAILFLRTHQFGRWSLAIGAISYSLYLTHTSIGIRVMQFGKEYTTNLPGQIGLMMAALAIAVASGG